MGMMAMVRGAMADIRVGMDMMAAAMEATIKTTGTLAS